MDIAHTNFALRGLCTVVLCLGMVAGFVKHAQAGGRVDQQDYEFTAPAQGYEGRTPTGVGYCSYRNVPKRKCKTVNGKEKCKVVGYTLQQFCQGRY